MNDDFLHRLREAPSPEFLARLKARLDRVPLPVPTRPRASSFARGLMLGLLFGGAAVAIAAVALNGVPESLRAFMRAPAQVLAHLLSGSSDERKTPDHHGVVPLGPAWFPVQPGSQPGATVDGAPVAFDPNTAPSTRTATSTGAASARDAQSGPVYGWKENLTIFAAFDMAPLAQVAIGRNTYPGARFRVEPTGNPAGELCRSQPYGAPEIIVMSRRMTPGESSYCSRMGLRDIIEVKIGYQAIALARSRLYGPLSLSARNLFQGLARQLPDVTQPERLVNNSNATWNQVAPGLPYDPILLLGPSLGWVTGQLVRDLLLEPGCNTYAWVPALRDQDPIGYESICRSLRADNVYREDMFAGSALLNGFTDHLVGNPTAIGIFSLNQLEEVKDKVLAISIDGVEPTIANVANGTYPLSRSLYIYAIKRRTQGTHTFSMIVRYNMAAATARGGEVSSWAFIPLPDEQRTAVLANVDALKESSN